MKKKKISTFFNNFADFFAVTIRDAIYLILVFVLNDDNEISLAFEIGTDRFLFNVVYDKKVTASIIKVSKFIFMLFILNFVGYFWSFSTISSGYVCSLAI